MASVPWPRPQGLVPDGRTVRPKPGEKCYPDLSAEGNSSDTPDDITSIAVDKQYLFGLAERVHLGNTAFSKTPEAAALRKSSNEEINSQTSHHNYLDDTVRPIHELEDIFDDIAKKLKSRGFYDICQGLPSNGLNVFTMCSGTEAPVIGMSLLNDAFKRQDFHGFRFNHVASVEIEPFKQAYIQRNFKPPLLFRDVSDFADTRIEMPFTVYGAKAKPPANVDILIAGTSCVDYSALNRQTKGFKEKGESWVTMWGAGEYARAFKPKIILLENVANAPWDKIKAYWAEIGYECQPCKLDSKDFYTPHTRERGYMVGFHKQQAQASDINVKEATASWLEMLQFLERRASSPFDSFIYRHDSPEFEVLMRTLTKEAKKGISMRKRGNMDWLQSRARHTNTRSGDQLGYLRPYTNWQPNGSLRMPDSHQNEWLTTQPDRIRDLLDINHLRYLQLRNYDMSYKSRMIDLSQNVDRALDNKHWGIVDCVTPRGIPWYTRRGGPGTGRDALALQLIPHEDLQFTTETSRQLQDLAGNAMTTTVVLCGIISAICAAIKPGKPSTKDIKSFFPLKSTTSSTEPKEKSPQSTAKSCHPEKSLFRGSKSNTESNTDASRMERDADSIAPPSEWVKTNWIAKGLHPRSSTPDAEHLLVRVSDLKTSALKSRRLCSCEGSSEIKNRAFFICIDCGYTACETCKGNPLHNYQEIPLEESRSRQLPSHFGQLVTKIFPKSLQFEDKEPFGPDLVKVDNRYAAAANKAFAAKYFLESITHGRSWKILYRSDAGRLELQLSPTINTPIGSLVNVLGNHSCKCQWQLYASCGKDLPVRDPLRKLLAAPIAVMVPRDRIFDGKWEFRDPRPVLGQLRVKGVGRKLRSWESKQGLQGAAFRHRQEFEFLDLTFKIEERTKSLGRFLALPSCTAAQGSLRRREGLGVDGETEYFFLDPLPLADAKDDSYVISSDHDFATPPEARQNSFILEPSWRPHIQSGELNVEIQCFATPGPLISRELVITTADLEDIVEIWERNLTSPMFNGNVLCTQDNQAFVSMVLPLTGDLYKRLTPGNAYSLDLVGRRGVLKSFEWLLTSLTLPQGTEEWQTLAKFDGKVDRCGLCAPEAPGMKWAWTRQRKRKKKIIRPYDDHVAAGKYETGMKNRPSPATAKLYCYEHFALLEANLNLHALLDRCLANLQMIDASTSVTAEWRIVHTDPLEPMPVFSAPSVPINVESQPLAPQPDHFKRRLWTGQLQTLDWMRRVEQGEMEWSEIEQSEVFLPSLKCTVQVRTTATVPIRGGFICDPVGGGKTSIALGHAAASPAPEGHQPLDSNYSFINSKATLILVPADLIDQWHSHIPECFDQPRSRIIYKIESMKQLEKLTWNQIANADIVIASMALMDDLSYWELFRLLACAPNVPLRGNRAVSEWCDMAMESLSYLIGKLAEPRGEESFWEAWNEKKDNDVHKFAKFMAFKKRKDVKNTDLNIVKDNGAVIVPPPVTKFTATPAGAPYPIDPDNNASANAAYSIEEDREDDLDHGYKDDFTKFEQDRKIPPLFHLFKFRRVMVDEFTYLEEKSYIGLAKLRRDHIWMLSATPPLSRFDGINAMAHLLGTKVSTSPVRAEMLGMEATHSDTIEESTYREIFDSYCTSLSPDALRLQHEQAKRFIRTFARSNKDAINWDNKLQEHVELVIPSSLEYATYWEVFVEVFSQAQKYNVNHDLRKLKDMSREAALQTAIEASSGPEDALFCSTSIMKSQNSSHGPDANAARKVLEKVEGQFVTTLKAMFECVVEAWRIYNRWIGSDNTDSDQGVTTDVWKDWVNVVMTGGDVGDQTVMQILDHLVWDALQASKIPGELKYLQDAVEEVKAAKAESKGRAHKKQTVEKDVRPSNAILTKEMKLRTKELSSSTLKLAQWASSMRFFQAVARTVDGMGLQCSSCGVEYTASDVNILVTCGHLVCKTCRTEILGAVLPDFTCPHPGCGSELSDDHLVNATRFAPENAGRHCAEGSRMQKVIATVRGIIQQSKCNYVLIFAQSDCIRDDLLRELHGAQIPVEAPASYTANGKTRANEAKVKVPRFKTGAIVALHQDSNGQLDDVDWKPSLRSYYAARGEPTPRVLVLTIDSVNAAGWNLQCISHVLFVAPLLTKSLATYKAMMRQAIGRSLRYGQRRELVHVHYFAMAHTIEVNILEQRQRKFVVKNEDLAEEAGEDEAVFVEPREAFSGLGRYTGPGWAKQGVVRKGAEGGEEEEEEEGGEELEDEEGEGDYGDGEEDM
ncbi:hypothetical protein DV735_g1113, partial [Chaetothyriales sp. CBS 134920]